MTDDAIDEQLHELLERCSDAVPSDATERVLARHYRAGPDRRGPLAFIALIAAMVLVGATAITTGGVGSGPASTAPGWRLVSAVGAPTWDVAGQTDLVEAQLTCPTTATCYEEGQTADQSSRMQIAITHDGGRTWTHWVGPQGYLSDSGDRLACAGPDWCFTALQYEQQGDRRFFVTTDGGATWRSLPGPDSLPSRFATVSLTCSAPGSCVVIGFGEDFRAPGLALVTTNGWRTWSESKLPAGFETFGAQCFSGGNCIALGTRREGDGIFYAVAAYSDDGGRTWSSASVPSDLSENVSLSCIGPLRCLASVQADPIGRSAKSEVWASTDGGRSWSITAIVHPRYLSAYGVDCATLTWCWGDIIPALTLHEDLGQAPLPDARVYFVTHDEGRRWQKVALPPHIDNSSGPGSNISCPTATVCFALGNRDPKAEPFIHNPTGALVLMISDR